MIFCEFFDFDFNISMRHNISETITYTAPVSYGFPHLIKNHGYNLLFFCVCDFFNFTFKFVMRHYWATAYLFVTQMLTLVGHTVLRGHGFVSCSSILNLWFILKINIIIQN